ncbi:MAG: DUF2497 domain-containing protein [Alphaproteobacteria bacterium]|jgi:cell pole-organizing protein PopZ|nr:DUF2497 domain-containing protein [Alphaproteobacteria bacterium]
MSKQQDNNQDPSIEEILDSIRQIISDDDEGAPAQEAPAPPADDVIELTEKAPVKAEEIVVDMQELEEALAEPEPAAPPPAAAAPPAPPPPPKPEPKPEPKDEWPPKDAEPVDKNKDITDDLSTILTRNAEDSVMGAFTELTKRASIDKGEGHTVEDVVREELKPMLKQWLDKHLPSMVERLLQKEMERISKRVLGDE